MHPLYDILPSFVTRQPSELKKLLRRRSERHFGKELRWMTFKAIDVLLMGDSNFRVG